MECGDLTPLSFLLFFLSCHEPGYTRRQMKRYGEPSPVRGRVSVRTQTHPAAYAARHAGHFQSRVHKPNKIKKESGVKAPHSKLTRYASGFSFDRARGLCEEY